MVFSFSCVAVQDLFEFWGDLYAPPGTVGSGINHDQHYTHYSSLRKFPGAGQHPLPQVTKLTALLVAFTRCDEARRELLAKFGSLLVQEIPHCRHANSFWFPECGPVLMDTMKPKVILHNIPSLQLCSDCGCCMTTSAPHTPHITLP
jgi:hypothetical protein